MGFFTIIMEVENGPLEINLLFQRPLFYCYGRVRPGKINSLLLKIGLPKRKGLSSNPHFSAASWLNCGDAVYIPRITTEPRLDGGFKQFLFSPLFREDFQFD